MIPIVCSAVAVSACDASSAGLCVVQVFGGGRRAGGREGGGIGGREEGDKEKRWRRNMRIGRRRRSRCVWSRMRMRVGPRVWDTLPMHMPACIVHKASTLIL